MKVVIVGGGFGGVKSALNLANKAGSEVKLIAPNSYFEYHAALYRSATGRSPLEVVIPLAEFFKHAPNVEVVQDKIINVDEPAKTAISESGSHYHFDKLILGVGAVTNFMGIAGLEEYSYGVKTIQEALKLKRHLHEDLNSSTEGARHYVVVGAGATGVELAAEMVTYLKKVRRWHRRSTNFTVDLIEAAPRILPSLPEAFGPPILKRLQQLGVGVHLSTAIKAETVNGLTLPHGHIKAHTVVWTAGVANNPLFSANAQLFKLMDNGKTVVNEYLEAKKDIYVIGDSAQTAYSGMAQTALNEANFVVADLERLATNRPREPYLPKRPIYAIPVGPRWSAVLWGRLKIYGYVGWWLRRLADLRLYLKFLPLTKALNTWRYGFMPEETCPVCQKRF